MAAPFGDTAVPTKYRAAVLGAAVQYGVPPSFLAAQIDAESGFRADAVSPDGAIGIAQFMPGTAKSVNLNPYDPTASIYAMAKLMAYYKKQYGSWEKALYAYHDGEGKVNTPGPAGIAYAKEILGKVGTALPDTGEGETITPVVSPSSLLDLAAKFKDPGHWRRVGLFAAGFLLLALGAFFLIGSKAVPIANKVMDVKGKVMKSGTQKATDVV
jgi:hypothetical protein